MDRKLINILNKLGFSEGMCLGSKSGYRSLNPQKQVIFNAKVFTDEKYYWWGDIVITNNEELFTAIASDLKQTLYITYENYDINRILKKNSEDYMYNQTFKFQPIFNKEKITSVYNRRIETSEY